MLIIFILLYKYREHRGKGRINAAVFHIIHVAVICSRRGVCTFTCKTKTVHGLAVVLLISAVREAVKSVLRKSIKSLALLPTTFFSRSHRQIILFTLPHLLHLWVSKNSNYGNHGTDADCVCDLREVLSRTICSITVMSMRCHLGEGWDLNRPVSSLSLFSVLHLSPPPPSFQECAKATCTSSWLMGVLSKFTTNNSVTVLSLYVERKGKSSAEHSLQLVSRFLSQYVNSFRNTTKTTPALIKCCQF